MEVNEPVTNILGKQDSAHWDLQPPTNNNPVLKYQHVDVTGEKNVEIEMICNEDQADSVEAVGEIHAGLYRFKLSSKCACWNRCDSELF